MKNASLKNKTVIVTAGNQGGGAIVSARFAKADAKVAIIAQTDPLNKTPLTQVSDTITRSGGTAQTWEVDLLNATSIRTTVNEIASQFGQIIPVIPLTRSEWLAKTIHLKLFLFGELKH